MVDSVGSQDCFPESPPGLFTCAEPWARPPNPFCPWAFAPANRQSGMPPQHFEFCLQSPDFSTEWGVAADVPLQGERRPVRQTPPP